MYHDARVGEAMPFPLFACADDRTRKFRGGPSAYEMYDEPAERRSDPMDAAWPTQ